MASEKCVEVGSSGIKVVWHMVPAVPCPSTQQKEHTEVTRVACSLTSRFSSGKKIKCWCCGLCCSCFEGTEGGAHGTSGLAALEDIQFCSCTYENVSLAQRLHRGICVCVCGGVLYISTEPLSSHCLTPWIEGSERGHFLTCLFPNTKLYSV